MASLNQNILENIGGIDCNNLKLILEDFDITKDRSQEHFSTSSYYDLEGTIQKLSDQNSNFTILTLNIECLNSKFDKLTSLILMLFDHNVYLSR